MRLRTIGLVAGVLGLVVLAVGLVADANRLEPRVTATATVETGVVVIGPEVLELSPDGRVTVEGDGALVALSARPADAKAWLGDFAVTYVTGLAEWEELTLRKADRVVATPDVSESPEPTASPSPTASPTAEPTPEATEAASEDNGTEEDGTEEDGNGENGNDENGNDDDATEDEAAEGDAQEAEPARNVLEGSSDHWRQTWNGTGTVSVATAAVPAGQPLLVVSQDGEPLQRVNLTIDRDINDGWISPLIWWGIFLVAVGLLSLIYVIIDMRPVQAKLEGWMAHRRRIGSGNTEPKPGSRRARRAAGQGVPVAPIDEDDTVPPVAAEPASEPASEPKGATWAAPEDHTTEGEDRS